MYIQNLSEPHPVADSGLTKGCFMTLIYVECACALHTDNRRLHIQRFIFTKKTRCKSRVVIASWRSPCAHVIRLILEPHRFLFAHAQCGGRPPPYANERGVPQKPMRNPPLPLFKGSYSMRYYRPFPQMSAQRKPCPLVGRAAVKERR